MRQRVRKYWVALIGVVLLATGCTPEEAHINVSSEQMQGLWVASGSNEFWRYRADGTGVTWDEDEDITEQESNLTFTWTIDVDCLTLVFRGEMGNQYVPKVYTVTAISDSKMTLKDDYSVERNYIKVE